MRASPYCLGEFLSDPIHSWTRWPHWKHGITALILLLIVGLLRLNFLFVCLANLSQSTCEGQRTALVVGHFLPSAEPDPMLYRVNISGQLTLESSIIFSVLTSRLGVGVLCRAVVGDTLSANDWDDQGVMLIGHHVSWEELPLTRMEGQPKCWLGGLFRAAYKVIAPGDLLPSFCLSPPSVSSHPPLYLFLNLPSFSVFLPWQGFYITSL